jgi:hypothetical protein
MQETHFYGISQALQIKPIRQCHHPGDGHMIIGAIHPQPGMINARHAFTIRISHNDSLPDS